ncbi:MAG: indolepyruvate oxidoreductase subunit beta family protein [Paracoccaceae bacterium]
MNDMSLLPETGSDTTQGEVIKLACLAVGGQGGGVLGNWIEDTARAQGYACQATSVAGVAQRTGSTVYYIEMAPADQGTPIFSLMPSQGDVDIVVGAELMETGRAIMRGFVTPDRTTLIGSTHRVISIAEKMVPGNGEIPPDEVHAAAEIAANKLILHDLEKVANDNGSVISASLFGALAGSGALPFPREAFEDAIKRGGKGVEASLRAFAAAYTLAQTGAEPEQPVSEEQPASEPQSVEGPAELRYGWEELVRRVDTLPDPVQDMARLGLRAVVDYQSVEYGAGYLDRLDKVQARDSEAHGWELTTDAAKYIAKAMAYDDVIRVADLKTRGTRFDRVRDDVQPAKGTLMMVTEFMHPRAEEIVGLLPARMGARWEASPKRMALVDKLFNRGRRVRSDGLIGFGMLYVLGGLRGWRLRTLRHAQEQAHLDRWLALVTQHVATDYALAVEIVRCRRLIKGYSDTHARGHSKFDRVLGALDTLKGREDAADWVRRLREAALQDEQGEALDGALQTIASFTEGAAA